MTPQIFSDDICSGDVTRGFEGFVINEVKPLNWELGRGARVFAVKYCEMTCAAKEVHSDLAEGHRIVDMFLRECHQCSKLCHPNIVQFLGVYYPAGSARRGVWLPVMVIEMNLVSFVERQQNIRVDVKFSTINDVALGLCYLHNRNPPVVHHDLSPNNILLTVHNVAKIGDLGVAKMIQAGSKKTTAPGTIDFMPPEAGAEYGPSMDVFLFAGIIYIHLLNKKIAESI